MGKLVLYSSIVIITAGLSTGYFADVKDSASNIVNNMNKQRLKAGIELYYEQHGEYPIYTNSNIVDFKKLDMFEDTEIIQIKAEIIDDKIKFSE